MSWWERGLVHNTQTLSVQHYNIGDNQFSTSVQFYMLNNYINTNCIHECFTLKKTPFAEVEELQLWLKWKGYLKLDRKLLHLLWMCGS